MLLCTPQSYVHRGARGYEWRHIGPRPVGNDSGGRTQFIFKQVSMFGFRLFYGERFSFVSDPERNGYVRIEIELCRSASMMNRPNVN